MDKLKSKLKASFIHLMLSLMAVCLVLFVVSSYWYPGSLFSLEKTWDALRILVPVDIVLGPLLTLALYSPGKKNLKLDLSIIAFFQVFALFYGVWAIYTQRPALIVFDVKEFQVISAPENIHESLGASYFPSGSGSSLRIVYAIPPKTPEEIEYFLTKAIPYQKQSERLRPIDDYVDIIKLASISLESLEETKDPEDLAEVKKKLVREEVYLFPLRGSLGGKSYVIVDLKNRQLVDFIDIDDLPLKEEG